jgi:hypothetical protein
MTEMMKQCKGRNACHNQTTIAQCSPSPPCLRQKKTIALRLFLPFELMRDANSRSVLVRFHEERNESKQTLLGCC